MRNPLLMDQIDINLAEAWERIGARCRIDRLEALRRFRRARDGICAARPVRAWCLCIRAADRRIDSFRCAIQPPGFDRQHLPHVVRLDGKTIGHLTKPVMIPWPGVPAHQAARLLGMSTDMVRRWMNKGWLKLERRDYSRMWGKLCRPLPIVYTPAPIDSNNVEGRPPDRLWGALWQHLWERLPAEFEQKIKRVPRYGVWKGEHAFSRVGLGVSGAAGRAGARNRPQQDRREGSNCDAAEILFTQKAK